MALILLLVPIWLCWGSFLNVVAYRLVREQSIVRPRSRCPHCQHQLTWYDNIPVISWIILGGACRYCHRTISALYPLIELLTVIVMSMLCLITPSRYIPAYFIFFSALIVTLRSDLETMLISQYVTLFIIPIGFICSYFNLLPISLTQSFMGTLFGYGFLWTIAYAFKIITGKKGMGEGDFELLALIGSFLGISGTWYSLMVASILGAVVGIIMMSFGKAGRNTKIPFGPFLSIAGILLALLRFTPIFVYLN